MPVKMHLKVIRLEKVIQGSAFRLLEEAYLKRVTGERQAIIETALG